MDVETKKICLRAFVVYATRGVNLTDEQLSDLYQECFDMAQNLGDIRTAMNSCKALGDLNNKRSRFFEALKYYEMYLSLAKQSGDRAGEGGAYGDLGVCYNSLGQYAKAEYHHKMCLQIAKRIGDKAIEACAYGNLGICYYSHGKFHEAIHHHEMCLNNAKEIGNKALEGNSYSNIGICYRSLGEYDKAIDHYLMSLNIAKQIGDKAGEGRTFGHLGTCYHFRGLYEKAIDHHEESLNIAKQIGDKAGEGRAYASFGICYDSLAQYDKAIHHYEMSLNIAKQIGDKVGEEGAYCNLGSCYYSLGQQDKAIHHHGMCLDIAKQIGDKAGEGIAYDNLGNSYRSLGKYENAIKYHEMCLNIEKQIGDKTGEGCTHGNLGNCYLSLGQYDKAIHHFEMSLNIAKQAGDKSGEGSTYGSLGTLYLSLGQYYTSELNLTDSVQCFEELFGNVPKQDQLKVSIRDTFIKAYRLLTRALLCQHKDKQALVIAERGRARALADLMFTSYSAQCSEVTETRVLDLCDIYDVVKEIGTSVLFLSFDFMGICMWLIQPNGDVKFKESCIVSSTETKNCNLLTNPAGVVEEKLTSLIGRACKTNRKGCTADIEDRSLSFLYSEEVREQTAKNEVGCDKTSDSSGAVEMETARSPVSSFSSTFQRNATSSQKTEDRNIEEIPEESTAKSPLKELYQLVLAPVRQFVCESQLVIVADGALNLVPFPALVDENDRYVVGTLHLRLVPSLATAKLIMKRPQEPRGQARPLIVGNPHTVFASRLPGAYDEAQMIGQLFGVQPFTGKDATKTNILENIEKANLIHIAAHGDMKRGEILLASEPGIDKESAKKEDYMLLMSELENKRLKAKLVVLSCCHSARGEVKADGVIGIARAFIGAGARAVLVALWAISDKATFYFMKTFYEHLIRGESANECLDKAMKDMRDTKAFDDPRFWSPFVLIGDNVSLS